MQLLTANFKLLRYVKCQCECNLRAKYERKQYRPVGVDMRLQVVFCKVLCKM